MIASNGATIVNENVGIINLSADANYAMLAIGEGSKAINKGTINVDKNQIFTYERFQGEILLKSKNNEKDKFEIKAGLKYTTFLSTSLEIGKQFGENDNLYLKIGMKVGF